MASLTITASRNDDNSTTITVRLPPRRNGEVNFGALARINQVLLVVNPDAFDPPEPPALTIAHKDGHTADGAGLVLATMQHDAAEAGNALNVGDANGPGEV